MLPTVRTSAAGSYLNLSLYTGLFTAALSANQTLRLALAVAFSKGAIFAAVAALSAVPAEVAFPFRGPLKTVAVSWAGKVAFRSVSHR